MTREQEVQIIERYRARKAAARRHLRNSIALVLGAFAVLGWAVS